MFSTAFTRYCNVPQIIPLSWHFRYVGALYHIRPTGKSFMRSGSTAHFGVLWELKKSQKYRQAFKQAILWNAWILVINKTWSGSTEKRGNVTRRYHQSQSSDLLHSLDGSRWFVFHRWMKRYVEVRIFVRPRRLKYGLSFRADITSRELFGELSLCTYRNLKKADEQRRSTLQH